jgi:FkbM family methyltransferase
MGKLATVQRVFRTQGAAGIIAALRVKYLDKWLGKQHNWWYGRWVELWGNVATIDGCKFSLDSPAIATKIKSLFLFDEYEKPEREAIRRFLDPTLPVVEFGGSVGVVSCTTNRRLSDPRRHVVVEANPELFPVLKKNRDLNRCEFEVLPYMVGYGGDRAAFYASRANFLTSTSVPAASDGPVEVAEVKTISLRSILDQYRFDRCTLICDIEGGEADLIRNECVVLSERVSMLILELHEQQLGKERAGELLDELETLGFQIIHSTSDTYVFRKGG